MPSEENFARVTGDAVEIEPINLKIKLPFYISNPKILVLN